MQKTMLDTRIESFLSARLFLAPERVGDRIYFVSNMSGRLSLYAMDADGSVPELLLPPDLALQNPELLGGEPFAVLPSLGKIMVMIDRDGDEVYQPKFIPIDGGFPVPAFGEQLNGYRVSCPTISEEDNVAYFYAQSTTEPVITAFKADLATGTLTTLAASGWGPTVVAHSDDHKKAIILEGYTVGDVTCWLWEAGASELKLLYGAPIEQRSEGHVQPLSGFGECFFTPDGRGIAIHTSLFEDTYGLGYIAFDEPQQIAPVKINGLVHTGLGEQVGIKHLTDDRYELRFNIDGSAWIYECVYDAQAKSLNVLHVIVGQGRLAGGVVEGAKYDKYSDTFALSFSTAISPSQLYVVNGRDRATVTALTHERVLGIPDEYLSPGEDASFTSHDGMRISARLYMPAEALGYEGKRPLVYYVHGGPQSQERPNFAWFSMPLIQFLALNGFAVFVPNVRGSTGYGLSYTKHVDRDWGGQDRLDHVHAMGLLGNDPRIDTKRAAVVGRSYGGYMTLILATQHPDLWSAACDMFGPYDLTTFLNRIPETWKPYFWEALGDPVKDKDFLLERSAVTHIDKLSSPLLVIQGKNDPRVVEAESRDVVEKLRKSGKTVDYLMFENEGHDVLKFENRVRCYNAITDFFKQYLKP
jgi:esterase/lipase